MGFRGVCFDFLLEFCIGVEICLICIEFIVDVEVVGEKDNWFDFWEVGLIIYFSIGEFKMFFLD